MKWIFFALSVSDNGTIDRIEDDFAVMELDSGEFVEVLVTSLPSCAQEGVRITSWCGTRRCTVQAQCKQTPKATPSKTSILEIHHHGKNKQTER